MTIAVSERHEFEPFPGGRKPNACMRCGRTKAHTIHQVPPKAQPPLDHRKAA